MTTTLLLVSGVGLIDDLFGWSEDKSVVEITLTPSHIKRGLSAISKAEER
jgi:hypothetical protein